MDSLASLFRKRITKLRIDKGVSEYQMSIALGQSKGYIQQISSGRSLPSMQKFFEICDYFSLSPLTFFDFLNQEPLLIQDLVAEAKELPEEEIRLLITISKHFKEKKSLDN